MSDFFSPPNGYVHGTGNNALQLLLHLRLVTLGIIIIVAALAHWALGVAWPLPAFIAVVMGFAGMSVWAQWRIAYAHQKPVGKEHLNSIKTQGFQSGPFHRGYDAYEPLAHAVVDVILFSAFLYITGGVSNPFAVLYLPLLGVAAMLLPLTQLMVLGVLCVAAYSLLMQHYIPLILPDPSNAFALHVFGMWANFAFSAVLLVGFVLRLNAQRKIQQIEIMRIKAEQLQEQKMAQMLQEQAQWAHRLATPLSTILMVVDDLAEETSVNTSHEYFTEALKIPLESVRKSLLEFKRFSPNEEQSSKEAKPSSIYANKPLSLLEMLVQSQLAFDTWKTLNPWSTLTFDTDPDLLRLVQDDPNGLYCFCNDIELKGWLQHMTSQAAVMMNQHQKYSNQELSEKGLQALKVSMNVGFIDKPSKGGFVHKNIEQGLQYTFYALKKDTWQPLAVALLACESAKENS